MSLKYVTWFSEIISGLLTLFCKLGALQLVIALNEVKVEIFFENNFYFIKRRTLFLQTVEISFNLQSRSVSN